MHLRLFNVLQQPKATSGGFIRIIMSEFRGFIVRGHKGNWGRGHRYHGRGRGYGNRSREHHFSDDQVEHGDQPDRNYLDFSERERDRSTDSSRGQSRPPGLRGRDIGMWYAKRGQEKKEREEKQQRPMIQMNKSDEYKIRSVLNDLGAASGKTESAHSEYSKYNQHNSSNPRSSCSYGSDWFDNYDIASTAKKPNTFQIKSDLSRADVNNTTTSIVKISSELSGGCQKNESKHKIFVDSDDSDNEFNNQECSDVSSFQDFMEISKFESDYMNLTADAVNDEFTKFDPSAELDNIYKCELETKMKKTNYINMMRFRQKLPAFGMKKEIVQTVQDNQVIIVSGETGCGKTTQVPQFILDSEISRGRGSRCHIICTQPRRISAISVAERVAEERAVKCGGEDVGYMIRLESRQPRPRGSILFCTTGCVLKFLESDPSLTRATHIIIDEIHERDLQSDFLMIILKNLLPVRPDLKVLLMSATLNAEKFSEYFYNSPMLHIPGFTYPVEEVYLENVIEMLGYKAEPSRYRPKRLHGPKKRLEEEKQQRKETWLRSVRGNYSDDTINSLRIMDDKELDLDLISNLISYIVQNKPDGAILVFVPGWSEISNLNKRLLDQPMFNSNAFIIIPLHSLMPTVNQRQVFNHPPAGVRKIIIATNIAETSITIDDIVYVIDGGKIKLKDFEPENNLSTLESKQVSVANAKQRRGRAGRVQSGICYRMFTRQVAKDMIDYFPPEILRTRLEEICLQIKILKLGKILPFVSKAMEPPSITALDHAIKTLQELHALDYNEELLPLGYHLARMPVDPHTGKMILFGAMFGCLDPVLTVAASLGFKTAFYTPLGKEGEADAARISLSAESQSDHILLINAMKGWEAAKSRGQEYQFCREYFLSSNTLKLLSDMKGQLAKLIQELGFSSSCNHRDPDTNVHSSNLSLVKAVICAGLYPNVAKIGKCPRTFSKKNQTVKLHLKDGRSAAVHPVSVNSRCSRFNLKWVVYHKKLKTSNIYIHDCSTISPYPLLLFGGEINLLQDDGDCVSVDEWIIFKSSTETANLVKDLRLQLDRLLCQKITRPGPTDWSLGSKEGKLLKLITDLVTKEDDPNGRFGNYSS